MTNGDLTKQILKAAQAEMPDADLLNTAKRLMQMFPLSSNHLLYNEDKPKVAAKKWAILLKAAVETDKEKLVGANQLLKEAGLKPDRSYGRYRK